MYWCTYLKTISMTSHSVFNAPVRNGESMASASFLNNPIKGSAAALSHASPTLPMEACRPSNASVSV